jgi:hypothetical protein
MIRMDYVFRFVLCCLTHSMCVFFARDVRNQEVQRGAIAFKSCACQRMHFCCKWGRNRWSVELHPCSTTQRGGRCQQIPTMSRKYLYLHGYQGKCRGFLDCQIVASMDIIKYTIYIYIMTYHDHYNVIITSILWYLRIFMTEADWGSESQWPSDCDENVGLTGCSGEVQQHQATPTGNVTSAVWILSRNFDISRSLERSRERFLIKTWSLWSEDLCFFEKTLQSEGCGVAEGRWHLRRFPHGHPPKLGDGDTHQWRLQVPLRPLDWNHHWELEANLKIMWVFVGVIVIN